MHRTTYSNVVSTGERDPTRTSICLLDDPLVSMVRNLARNTAYSSALSATSTPEAPSDPPTPPTRRCL